MPSGYSHPANRRDEAIVALNNAQITLLFMLFLLHFLCVALSRAIPEHIMCHVFAKTCYLSLSQTSYRQDSLNISFPFKTISSDDIPAISRISMLTASIPISIFGVATVERDWE